MELYLYFLLFVSLYLLTKILLPKKKKNLPPSPPSFPILGHLHLIKKPLHRTLAKLSAKYGQLLYLRFGAVPVLVVSSASAVEECFTKKNDIVFANRPKLMMGKVLGQNYTSLISAPYGAHWRNLRRISVIEILSANRIQMFSEVRFKELKTMIKRLIITGDEYRKVNMRSTFFELTLNIMMMMIAGKRYYGEGVEDLEETKEFQEMVSDTVLLGGASNIGDYLPVLRWLGVNGYEKRLRSLKGKRDACMRRLIEGRRKARSEGGEKNATLIDVLLSLQENEPDYYSDEMIQSLVWVLFVAGTDTTSGTMEWAMSLLLNNPEVLKKAQSEIDNHVEPGRLVSESDLNKLPYLHSIINETLRMYPAAPLLVPHISSDNCIVGGYNIPKDTMLLVNLWSVQNDTNLWDEPTKFSPERFAGLEGTREGFKLMPFGSGRRGCPGEGLATHVVGLTLAALIQCFDWERIGNEMVDMSEESGLTLPKAQPLEAMCKPRSRMLNVIEQI
ncbi:hypothetical protein ACHQM5_001593 [Ranunculus cassubicifolius]